MAEFPTDEEILDAARKSGWLLEQEAVRVLENAEFHPRPGWAFRDTDDPTSSRELDVWSYHRFLHDEENKVNVAASILVECKQSATPYCAIGHEIPDWRKDNNSTEHLFPTEYFRMHKDGEKPAPMACAWDALGFRGLALKNGFTNFRANQLTRLDHTKGGKWEATNAGVFTSLLYPLAKAIRATQAEYRPNQTSQINTTAGRTGWLMFLFVFPVVLISSPLYVIDAGREEPAVSQAKWVRTRRDLNSSSVKGLFEFDVVTISAFAEYVQHAVIAFTSAAAQAISEDPRKYTGEAWVPPGALAG